MRWPILATLLAIGIAQSSEAGGPPPMYVVVDRVETDRCKGSFSRIRIHGAFTRLESATSAKFTTPVSGYIEFGYGSDPDVPKWNRAAGTGKVVAIGSCHDAGAFLTTPIRTGKIEEKANLEVTPYPSGMLERFGGLFVDDDLTRLPEVKALIAFSKTRAVLAPPDTEKFIQDAILKGLSEDGVPRAFAAQLAKNPDYLGKCQLCTPTRQAFVLYSQLEQQPAGKGLKEDLQNRLASVNVPLRQAALRELVAGYIERGYERSKMTKDERATMHQALEIQRKAGIGGLPQGQTFCPSCDGVCCKLK